MTQGETMTETRALFTSLIDLYGPCCMLCLTSDSAHDEAIRLRGIGYEAIVALTGTETHKAAVFYNK